MSTGRSSAVRHLLTNAVAARTAPRRRKYRPNPTVCFGAAGSGCSPPVSDSSSLEVGSPSSSASERSSSEPAGSFPPGAASGGVAASMKVTVPRAASKRRSFRVALSRLPPVLPDTGVSFVGASNRVKLKGARAGVKQVSLAGFATLREARTPPEHHSRSSGIAHQRTSRGLVEYSPSA